MTKNSSKERWYEDHKEITIERANARKQLQREWFQERKQLDVDIKGCQCGCGQTGGDADLYMYRYKDPSERFTTQKGKKLSISDMVGRYGDQKIEQELLKCHLIKRRCTKRIK